MKAIPSVVSACSMCTAVRICHMCTRELEIVWQVIMVQGTQGNIEKRWKESCPLSLHCVSLLLFTVSICWHAQVSVVLIFYLQYLLILVVYKIYTKAFCTMHKGNKAQQACANIHTQYTDILACTRPAFLLYLNCLFPNSKQLFFQMFLESTVVYMGKTFVQELIFIQLALMELNSLVDTNHEISSLHWEILALYVLSVVAWSWEVHLSFIVYAAFVAKFDC